MSYTAADITELDDVQHTRLRPTVNLGLDVLNTALRELVDNEPSLGEDQQASNDRFGNAAVGRRCLLRCREDQIRCDVSPVFILTEARARR